MFSGVGSPPEADYTEQSLFGYRWYDYHEVTPAYCFGHGLSYTSFEYGSLKTTQSVTEGGQPAVRVEVQVTNSGSTQGSEVSQLYLASPASSSSATGESKRALKSFVKLKNLAAGDSQNAVFSLSPRDLSSWDETAEDWKVVEGTYTAYVGTSSCDFRQSTAFVV